jgi:hypothetical protein
MNSRCVEHTSFRVLLGALLVGVLGALAAAESKPGGMPAVLTVDDATVIPAVMNKDAAKRKPARYVVLGTVADPAASVTVRLVQDGRADAGVVAAVSKEKRVGSGYAWSATQPGLKRGENVVEATMTPQGGKPITVKKTVTLNPIVAEPPEGATTGNGGAMVVTGISMLKYYVLDPEDVLALSLSIDGKQVADTNMYIWTTAKAPNGKHELKYTARYKEGEYVRTLTVEVKN